MRKVKLKVCGLTRAEDVAFCLAAGVEYLGFIMARESPRHILPAQAAAMPRHAAPPGEVVPGEVASGEAVPGEVALRGCSAKRVGVFTGNDIAEMERQAEEASVDLLQLHGGQGIDFCRALGPERVIKVLWPERYGRDALQREMDRFAPVCAYFLFDAGQGGGGTGRGFSPELLQNLAVPRPWFFAGGIGPDSAKKAAAANPHALDVNSGVESSPGIKDAAKIQAILRNIDC